MELCAEFYAHVCSILPGSTSVNELRVLTAIGLATLNGQHIGITEISTALDIPLSTASRIVSKFSESGAVIAVKHPQDDRRRSLRISSQHLECLTQWAHGWVAIHEQMPEAPAI
jgi:DNA-binding MarR family transcriptional regulator